MIIDIPYIERYVSDHKQESKKISESFFFTNIGETKKSNGDSSSILQEGKIRLIVTSGPTAKEEVKIHSDFIKDIAFKVQNIHSTYDKACDAGFSPLLAPIEIEGKKIAQIGSCGSLIHTLIEDSETQSLISNAGDSSLFNSLDHIALAVDDLEFWTKAYIDGLGLHEFCADIIKTDKTGMKTRVLRSENGIVTLFFAAPEKVLYDSQIDKFLDEHKSSGIQHIALSTTNIIEVVKKLKNAGVEFVSPPDNYYNNLPKELKDKFADHYEDIRDLQLFVDQDYNGEMMQVFTKPIQDRPTFFIEVIERNKAVTFGQNNVLALFKALENQFDNV